MKTAVERVVVGALAVVPLVLCEAPSAGAAEVWVRPTHFAPPTANVLWPTTGTGFVSFGFAVPDDMDSFVAARVALLPEATLAGSYDVYAEVKRGGEVVNAADVSFAVDNPVSLVEDELQEVDIGAVFSGLLDPNSPGNDYVSVFLWFPTGEPGADEGRVLGMRFVYGTVPLETASLADDAVTSAKVLDGSLTSEDIADGAGSGLDADLLDGFNSSSFSLAGHGHHGASWGGDLSPGLWVSTTGGTGVRGWGSTYGVEGRASSASGTGVYGQAVGDGASTGVYGSSSSSQGQGVLGSGGKYGVYGRSNSTGGVGVEGYAFSTTGAAYGVIGQTQSPSGKALTGLAWNGGVAVWAQSTLGGNPIEAHDGLSRNRVFYVDAGGSVFADGSYNCGLAGGCFNAGIGADLAERIDVTEALEPGDVVEVDPAKPGHFRRSRTPYSSLVVGVVSTQPAITLNNDDLADNATGQRTDSRPLLALAGRVPVKATTEQGPIRPGDLLTAASAPGHAMRAPHLLGGAIIGKALEPLDEGTGTVLMMVMLR